MLVFFDSLLEKEVEVNTRLVIGRFAVGLLSLSVVGGCFSVKTEHEIKPIHITMDINLMVKQDVESYLNDTRERSRARRDKIYALVDAGKAQELETGYIELKDSSDADAAKLVSEENDDRKIMYAEIAKKRGKTPEEVGKTAAQMIKIHQDERQKTK